MAHLGGKFYAGFCRLTRKNKSVKSDMGYKGSFKPTTHVPWNAIVRIPVNCSFRACALSSEDSSPNYKKLLLPLNLPMSKI